MSWKQSHLVTFPAVDEASHCPCPHPPSWCLYLKSAPLGEESGLTCLAIPVSSVKSSHVFTGFCFRVELQKVIEHSGYRFLTRHVT